MTTNDKLRDALGGGLPKSSTINSIRTQPHDVDRLWLTASPFCLMALFADGSCDVSPRRDAPCFALVLRG